MHERSQGESDFGGGSLKQLGPWLGTQYLGGTLGVLSCTEPPGVPLGGTRGRAEASCCQWGDT